MNRDVAQLRDEIRLREASMRDATRERDDGELSTDQFDAILARECAALEKSRSELGELMMSDGAVKSRRRVRRTRLLVVALICFALVLLYALFSATSPRQPGTSGDGGINQTTGALIDRLLAEAEVDVADNHTTTALSAYSKVLVLDPKNVTALTQSGWLDFTAGSAARKASVVELGIKDLEKAIAAAPKQPAPRLYFAIAADATPENQKVARTEFEEFLKLKPSVGQLAIARPFLKKLGITGS
jgi:cytochrome c-type biogenesis protein CcmH/NrfG